MRSPVGVRPARHALRMLTRRAARRYVAGPAVEDAVTVARAAADQNVSATIGAWTTDGLAAEVATARHRDAVRAVHEAGLDAVVAVKSPALGHRIDLLDAVVRAGAEAGIELCFDAHAPADADRTLEAARLAATGGPVGVALPTRWDRSARDARVARDAGMSVRVVKGSWPSDGREVDPLEGARRVLGELAGGASTVRIASHDPRFVAEALGRLRGTGTPAEVELLLGLPRRHVADLARAAGVPVRLYVPFGVADVPYDVALAGLRRHPALAARLACDVVRAAPSTGWTPPTPGAV